MAPDPSPIVVEPSGQFLGDDGDWSTFVVNVGNPAQEVHVVAATQVSSTWVVAPKGCPPSGASNCTTARGGLYDSSKSSSWTINKLYQLGVETNLGYGDNSVNGTYGWDVLALPGPSGSVTPSLQHQVVAAITTDAFYIGSLGIASAPVTFDGSDNTTPSFLSSLKTQGVIPSLSYGYTAGASYKNGGVNASLTLGGYDSSRFTPNSVSFAFAPTPLRQLAVGLQAITFSSGSTEKSLLSDGIFALIDSTVPYMWLPPAACQQFEAAFGITWDPIHNLYLINDTTHATLVKSNPSVVFELANSLSGGASINITLPYASFDLQASSPLMKTTSKYFPLQRAADDSSYTLGRTFLQEAYMVVDNERSNFTVSQAIHDSSVSSQVVAISPAGQNTGTTPSNPTPSSNLTKTAGGGSHGISTGAIAGIAIIIVLVALAGSIGGFFCARRRRRSRAGKGKELPEELEGDRPHGKASIEMNNVKDDSIDDSPRKKAPVVAVNEARSPMSPPHSSEMYAGDYFRPGSPSKPSELPGELPPRSELSTPEPFPELPSPDIHKVRHEATSPEPSYANQELPTPDPAHELPSPNSTSHFSDLISPVDPPSRSALSSPVPRLPRPKSLRMDSSESESGFTRDGMRNFHRRMGSNKSDRPPVTRRESGESAVLGTQQFQPYAASSENESGVSSPSTVTYRPSIKRTSQLVRPATYRTNSDTWETRLEMGTSSENSAPATRMNSRRHGRGSSEGDVETREGLLSAEQDRQREQNSTS